MGAEWEPAERLSPYEAELGFQLSTITCADVEPVNERLAAKNWLSN
jgi:hypothetical protein